MEQSQKKAKIHVTCKGHPMKEKLRVLYLEDDRLHTDLVPKRHSQPLKKIMWLQF